MLLDIYPSFDIRTDPDMKGSGAVPHTEPHMWTQSAPSSLNSNNEIGAKGAEEIVSSLASNRELADLNLRYPTQEHKWLLPGCPPLLCVGEATFAVPR